MLDDTGTLTNRAFGAGRRRELAVLIGLSLFSFLILMLPNFNRAYGYFIDEFYYLACARRLAFGYVDHPSLAPLLLRLSSTFLGTSVPAIRVLPAAAIAAAVFLTGLLARRLGGGMFAQILAALCVLSSPVFLIMGGFFSVNAFEILLWLSAVYVLLRILQTQDSRLWLVFGVVAGLGLQNKHTMALLGLALVVGLLFIPARRCFLDKWFWLGGAIAFGILLPNLFWQSANGWPSLEFYRNAELYKNVPTPPFTALFNQVLFTNPATLVVWLAGLGFYLFSEKAKQYRVFGWAYLALLTMMLLAQSSRPDRIAGVYPMLFAGGAIWWESLIQRRNWSWIRPILLCLVIACGLVLAPICLPILPPETTAAYTERLGVVPQLERGKTSPLPQWLADRFDWEEMLRKVAAVYRSLPPDQQKQAVIVAPSYGHAGAIELFARDYRLPHVISTHNTYFLWGMNEPTPQIVIAIGSDPEDLKKLYEEVECAGMIQGTYSMNWRRNMRISVARKPKFKLSDVWVKFKNFG